MGWTPSKNPYDLWKRWRAIALLTLALLAWAVLIGLWLLLTPRAMALPPPDTRPAPGDVVKPPELEWADTKSDVLYDRKLKRFIRVYKPVSMPGRLRLVTDWTRRVEA